MPNPAWTASDGGPGPSTSLPETDSVGNTTVQETTTDPTTATSDPTVTEPTTGMVTSDPSTSTTTSTSTSTTSTSSTSTTTGGMVCGLDDSLALDLELATSDSPAPFVTPEPPCDQPVLFVGGMNLDEGLKVTGVGGACTGGVLNSWIKVTGSYPPGAEPPLPMGSCARVYLHYVLDDETQKCRLAAYQIFPGPNFESGAAPLYAAGSGVLKLGAINTLQDYSPTDVTADCVADPVFCDNLAEGTNKLLWSQFQLQVVVPESAGPEDCGDNYSCYNLRAHRHGDDDQMCSDHLDWIIKKKQ